MKNSKFLFVVILLSSLLFLTGCAVTNNGNTNPDSTSEENNEPVDFTIEMSRYKYEPNVIEAQAGTTVKIKLVGEDIDHDFVIDGLDVKSRELSKGESQTLEVEIPENASGKSFKIYCSVSDHENQGMTGTLKVK